MSERVVEAVAAAQHRAAGAEHVECKPHARAEVIEVRIDHRASEIDAGELKPAGQVGQRISRAGVEVRKPIVPFAGHLLIVVAHAEVQRQPARYLPVVLHKVGLRETRVGGSHIGIDVGIGHRAQQEAGESRAGSGEPLRIAGETRVEVEHTRALETGVDAVHVLAQLAADLQRVLALDPRHAVEHLADVHRDIAANGAEAGREALQVRRAREVDAWQRDLRNARRQPQLAGGIRIHARRDERKRVAHDARAELVNQRRIEEVRICQVEILVAVVVVPHPRQAIRKVAAAGAAVVVFVSPRGVTNGQTVLGAEAVVGFAAHLDRVFIGAKIGDEVIGVGERVARRAVGCGVKGQNLLRNRIQAVGWDAVAGEHLPREAAAGRVGGCRLRVIDRDRVAPGVGKSRQIARPLFIDRRGANHGVLAAEAPFLVVIEEERLVLANRPADYAAELVVAERRLDGREGVARIELVVA